MKRVVVLSLLIVLAYISAVAQTEICNNGIDDDGDGFIDCYDSDCSGSTFCAGSFLGNNVVCQAKPSAFPQFTMRLKWQSPNKTTNHLNRASVGDLDRDGIPEVVVTEIQNGYIYILNGANGSIKKSLKVGYSLQRDPVIGNIDNSSCGWVFVTDGSQYIYAYDCNLNFKWKSTKLSGDPSLFGLADFDGDGKAEIYSRDEILAAESGIRIVKGTNTSNAAGGAVAVDILDASGNVSGAGDNKLELVSGCNIFTVNLGGRTLNSGSLTLAKNASSYFYWEKNGNTSLTSVADYNQDGFLDVIATGSTGSQSANATVFFWDVKNNAVKTYIDANPATVFIAGCTNASGTYYKNGWQNGIGRVNIADIDGDGKLNVSYISGKFLYALKDDFSLLWKVTVNEETSGYTGCTVYDFNGDGSAEVVYRDEQFLYIINGRDGSINTQQQCIARTQFEYPVVADLDADGQTELCVTCGFDDALAWSNFCNLPYSENSCVRVFSSASVPWVPSRKLWNQHTYFNVNVNDDLTIPKVMQKQLAIFSSGVCTIGANRALNAFLNQSPYLDSKGCPTYAAPDLINVLSIFKINQPVCPSTNFTVTLGVQNIGDASINGNVPVTFYNGDPTKAGATKLNTVTIPINLTKGQTQTFTSLTVTGTGGAFTLYVSLNDAGTSLPTPIVLPNTSFIECNYNGVISGAVMPNSVTVTALKVSDDVKCVGSGTADNGSAKAYVQVNGVQDIVDYNFLWYNGPVTGSPSYTGATYSGLGPGTYNVKAVNIATGCNSDTASITIAQIGKTPLKDTIIVDKPNSSCGVPNGQVHAVVNGGDPVTNYTFEWFEGNDIFTSPEIGTGSVASNLIGGKTYTVLVTDIASGCQAVTSLAVPNVATNPVVTASAVNAVCAPVNSGSVSAAVGGVTSGFTFNWYNGSTTKPAPDFIGAAYNAIPPGFYTVTATNNTSGCSSAPVTVQVSLPPPFTAKATLVTPQTSCNLATPNGSVTANVGGVTAGYTFTWFKGQNTAPANAVAGPTGLASGTYTTLATNTSTGCTDTAQVTVTQNLIYPVVTVTPAPNSTCDPAKGSSAYNGSVAATVTYNGSPVSIFTNYQFVWHQGSLATDPVIAGATNSTITQLNGGAYTLVLTRTDLGCAAPPATATVTNTQVLPAIATNQTPSTNCVVGKENGVAYVTQVNGILVGSTVNFTYQWYTGSNTAASIAGATNATLSNVQGGAADNYTVQVTDKTSGCQNTATVLVADAKVLPVLSLAKTNNTVCKPALTNPSVNYNGSVTATVTNQVGGLVNYSFSFGGGAGAGTPLPSPNQNQYTQLNGSATSYTVTATQTPTGCISSISTIVVNNTLALPVIVTGATGSTNCILGKENGQAQVTTVDGVAPGAAVGYTYSWANSVAPPFPVNAATNTSTTPQLIKVQGGAGYNYVVTVINQSSGCQNTASVNVPDSKVFPVLTLSKVDNGICNPALTNPPTSYSGQVNAASVTYNGAPFVPGGTLTYNFYNNGSGTGAASQSSASANYLKQNGGTYSATVTIDNLGCTSNVVSTVVNNNLSSPAIITSVDPSTNCVAGKENGAAHVSTVDGVSPGSTTNYTYQWYNGNTVTPANLKGGQTLPDLGSTTPGLGIQGGTASSTFTVLVTRNSDGCQSNTAATITDAKSNPVLAISVIKNNDICDEVSFSPDGSLHATVMYKGVTQPSPLAANWVVTWSTLATGENLTAQPAGNYTASVIDNNTGCASSNGTATIVDQLDIPVIAAGVVADQTSCDLANPNGQLQGSATNGPALSTLTYTWYSGNGTSGASVNTASGQAPGAVLQTPATLVSMNYTFAVRNEVTGCNATQSIFLPQQLNYPTFTGSVTDVTSCVPTNGELDITLTSITNPSQFTIYYLNEVNFAQTGDPSIVKANATTNGTVFKNDPTKLKYHANPPAISVGNPGLAPGTYTVVIRDSISHCQSNVQTFTVQDKTNKTATATLVASATFCSSGVGGKLNLTVNPPGVYTYSWHTGVPTNSNLNFMNNANLPTFAGGDPVTQTTQNLTGFFNGDNGGVGTGIYSVVVVDAVGCGKVFSDNIPFVGAPAIALTLSNSTQCDPLLSDASIKVDVTGIAGIVYSVRLFKGHNSAIPGTWINGEDDGCNNGIDDDGDGLIDLADPDCGTTNVHTHFNNASALLSGSASVLLGDYLVRVFDNSGAGCALEKVLTLTTEPAVPLISIDALGANTACTGGTADGSIKLTVNNAPNDSSNLALKKYKITAISPVPVGSGVPQMLNAGVSTPVVGIFSAQTYELTITDLTSGCQANQFVNVPSQPGLPTAFAVMPTNDEFCAPSTKGSALVTTLTGPAGNITNYNFEWYSDNALTTLVMPIAPGNGLNTGGEQLTAAKVIANNPVNWPLGVTGSGNGNKTFYARAQKQGGPGDKCYTQVAQVSINDTHVAPQTTVQPFSNTSCLGTPEGRIELTTVTSSPTPSISGSTYTYSWAPDPLGTSPQSGQSGASTFTIPTLPSNTYTVTALNETSQCSTMNTTTVLNSKFDISITGKTEVDQVICPIDGRIDVTEITIDRSVTGESSLVIPTSVGNLSTDFTYQWFNATPGNPGTFNNVTPIQDSTPATITGVSLTAGNGAQQDPAMGAGTYYVIATRTATAGLPAAGCSSKPVRVDVGDERVFPTVSFTTIPNSACDNNFDGKITVTATTPSGPGATPGDTYNFVWTNDPDGAGPLYSASNSPTTNTASPFSTLNTDLIGAGTYTIRVTNFVSVCFTDATVNVLNNTIPMSIDSVTSTGVDLCSSNDGTGTVVSIAETPGPGNTANYTYTWANNPSMTLPFATNTVGLTQNNLAVGTYYITATRNAVASPPTPGVTGSGCVTAPVPFNVIDQRVFPTVTFATTPSSSCDNNFDGSITVTATTTSGPGAGPGDTYYFDWTNDPDGPGPVYSATGSPVVNIASPLSTLPTDKIGAISATVPGVYTINVTNFATGCPTLASVNVLSNVPDLEILTVNKQDQAICNPDGSITVLTLSSGVPANYTFNWFRTDPTTPALVDATSTPITGSVLQTGGGAGMYPSMGAGVYFVTGTRIPGSNPGSGCSTPPFEVDINDAHVNPVIAATTINPDVNCAGAIAGVGQITINEATPLNYTYSWFAGDDTSGAPVLTVGGVNGEVAQTLQQGDYTVQVRSNATNCVSVESFTVANNPTIVDFDPAGFSAPGVTTCILATGAPANGSATVTSILENNTSQPLTNYTFLWTDALNNTLQNSAAPTLVNLPPGSYFVKATNSVSKCFGDLSFTINDQTIGSTTVTLANFGSPERCISPTTGFLLAQGGSPIPAATFSYQWFSGDQRPTPAGPVLTAPGPPLPAGGLLSNIAIAAGQTFTVKVINNSNNCWAVDAYSVPLIVNTIVITASANPLTFCSSNNGEVFSTIVNDNKFNYNFFWANGTAVNPPVDYTGNDIPNLPAGTYTVVAVDIADPGCVSPPVTVTIDNAQVNPVVTTTVLNNLTNCDPAKPDGVASADVGGDITHYTFDWYVGSSASGVSFYRGADVDSLTAVTYTVLATDIATGCTGQASVSVPNRPNIPPTPTIVVISNVTSCVTNNGILSASVGGVTKDYIFDWADGTSPPPPIDFTGEIYSNVGVGSYTVIATSRITGCVSNPATAPIIKNQIIPDFNFLVQSSICPNPPDNMAIPPVSFPSSGTGFVTLVVSDNAPLAEVTWYRDDGSFVSNGANLQDALPGKYKVTVLTTMGCETSKEVEVPVEILPYNGVSRRDGSHNYYFLINCINNFPDNHVEIFNRAGTKVYEANRYDNTDVLFDGKSNKGISLMGNNLPAGTYFYVISKGDGSRNIVGYLELVD